MQTVLARIAAPALGKHPEYTEPETLPALPSVEAAIAKVDGWRTSEANTTGLHMMGFTYLAP